MFGVGYDGHNESYTGDEQVYEQVYEQGYEQGYGTQSYGLGSSGGVAQLQHGQAKEAGWAGSGMQQAHWQHERGSGVVDPLDRADEGSFEEGGRSLDARVVVGPGRYYMGMIDVLQTWGWEKKLERFCKVHLLGQDAAGISCTPPPYVVMSSDENNLDSIA
jgi:hypothetical protein